MSALSPKNSSEVTEKFNIRFMALGAFIVFLSLFGGEKLVWTLADSDSKVFFTDALQRVSAPNITAEAKDEIRVETIRRLAQPGIVLVAILILVTPFLVGILLGYKAVSIWSGAISVFVGVWVTLAVSQAVTPGAAIASVIFAAISVPGSMTVKKVQKWRTIK